MKWVESKQQNSTSLPKAAFPAGRPPWYFPEVPAGRSRWVLRRFTRTTCQGAARCCVPFGWAAPVGPRPPGPGRGSGAVLRTLRVVRLLRGLGAQRPVAPPARQGSPFLPRNGEKEGRGPLSSVGSSVGTIAGWTLQRGFPADSGRGARLSLEKVGGKNTRAPALDRKVLWPLVPTRWFWDRCL